MLSAAIVNVALNLLAIPRFGIAGAAGASVIAYAFSIVLSAYWGRRYLSLPIPLRDCVRVLLASAAMVVVLLPLRGYHAPMALAAQIALGAVVYGVVLVAGNFLGLRERIVHRWAKVGAVAHRSLGSDEDAGGFVYGAVEETMP